MSDPWAARPGPHSPAPLVLPTPSTSSTVVPGESSSSPAALGGGCSQPGPGLWRTQAFVVLCQLHAQPGAADIPKECAGDGAACQGARSCWEPDGKALHCSQWWHCPFSRSPNNFQSWLRALVTVLPQRSLASPPDLQDLQDVGPPTPHWVPHGSAEPAATLVAGAGARCSQCHSSG